ncbi:MAG: response regulator transcription factor [Pseudomonadota bacterium]
MRVLLVEDERLIADPIVMSLEQDGHHVDWVRDADSAEDAIATSKFDLIFLDLGLPTQDGLYFLRKLRGSGRNEPVIILTAREAVENRVEGLDLGADDYLTKPFDMAELLARARAQVRRAHGRRAPTLTYRDVEVDPAAHTVMKAGKTVDVPPLAFQVLLALLERRGRVVSKDDLAESLYGWDDSAESNTVEVYVSHLRRKLGADLIRTIRGVGYIIDKD